jgi:transcription elongation GreA/GreB family factor
MSAIDKPELLRRLQSELTRQIAVLRQATLAAREGATHEEAKPENAKDTRALEASYLAGAQAARLRELEGVASTLGFMRCRAFRPSDPVAVSAAIELERDGERSWFFIAQVGGGLAVSMGKYEIHVVTPVSPLGRALLGKTVGEVVELQVPGSTREYEIVAIE